MSDITEIKRALNAKAREVAEYLLPRGVLDRTDWCAGSTEGEPGHSLKVCIRGDKAGLWSDFAAAGEGGDLIDLWCAVKRLTLVPALDEAREWLGMQSPRFERKEIVYKRPARPQCHRPRSDVLEYLTGERKLSEDAIRAYRIAEQDRTIVFPSILPSGELAFVKYLGLDRTPEGKKLVRVEPGCEPVLFGWQAIDDNAREITLTEGEVDSASAWDYGYPALSVPFGGGGGAKQRWIECEYDRLARFEVIYLALDMDQEGNAAVAEIVNRLGRHRCRRVMLPRKDLNQCRMDGIGAAEIRAAFEAAQSLDPPELVQPGSFVDAVVNLFWPSGEHEAGYRLPFAKVGERMVFRPAELSEWTGQTGSGKSQILSYALIAMAEQGARVCMASLEMAPAQVLRRMVKQAGNIDRPTEPFVRQTIGWMDSWLWMFGLTGKVSVTRLIEVFEYARCRYGCDVFAIDSLMRLGIGSEDYEGQEKAVFELVNWTVEKNVHVHLVAHARKGERGGSGIPSAEDVKGTSEIASNAANILGIWRNRKREEDVRATADAAEKGDVGAQLKAAELAEKATVVLNIDKQRNGDWEGKIGLWFNAETYQYRCAHDDRYGRKFAPSLRPVEAAD